MRASASTTTNEICFPAAILQPPFFDPTADDAMNYGGIGGVIGHEMSHGFDDQGSQFDKTGNQNNWWTAADKKNFESRTKILVDHFNKIELAGKKVNGQMTLGENIGDNGGAWLSSARVVRCSVKSDNERNPCIQLPIFPTAASRRSLDRFSVPMWPITLSGRLPIVGLVGRYLTNYLMGRELILVR